MQAWACDPAQIAQLVEHTLGKGEVGGSNPLLGSILYVACNCIPQVENDVTCGKRVN